MLLCVYKEAKFTMTTNEILFLMMLVFPFVVIEQLIQLKDRRKMQVIPKDFIKLEDFAYKKKALVNQDFNNAGIYIFTNLDNGAKYVGQPYKGQRKSRTLL